MGPTKKLIASKKGHKLRGLSSLQQIFDSMSHLAVIKILFATVAFENPVLKLVCFYVSYVSQPIHLI